MKFLMKLFVKDYERSGEDSLVRGKAATVAGGIGIASNLLLFIIKLIASLISGSVAMIADAINNLTDSVSSIVTIIGFKLAARPADDNHPFGHARMEYISGIIISFIMVFLGLQFGMNSIEKIVKPEETLYTPVVIAILVISIAIKFLQSMFYSSVGKQINSDTLIATAVDSRNDVVSTLAILIGAVISLITGINLDGVLGLLVAAFIVYSGIKLIGETSDPLLGLAPDSGLVSRIHEKIMSYDGVIGTHDLTVHNYGEGKCFASVHCEVPAEVDILLSHDIIDNIEREMLKEMNINLVIHMDPVVTSDERTNKLREDIDASIREIYPSASMHDFRVVWGITHSNLVFDVALPFSEKDSDREITNKLTKMVKDKDPDYNLVLTIDRTSKSAMI